VPELVPGIPGAPSTLPGPPGIPGDAIAVPGIPGAGSTIAGPPGIPGTDGAIVGIPGPRSTTAGPPGVPGRTVASPGVPGARGEKGDQGIQGIQGVPGPIGSVGATSVLTTAPLAGGGALTGDLTLSVDAATGSVRGTMSAADKMKLDGMVPSVANVPSTVVQRGSDGTIAASALSGNRYVFDQSVAATTWTIVHNLNTFPGVVVIDSAGTVCEGEVDYSDNTTVVVSFNSPFGGKAYLT